MTQGLYIRTAETGWTRPASKKAVKVALAASPSFVRVEATSYFGNEAEGTVTTLMDSAPHTITFVGPDPHTSRKFYGTLKVSRNGASVS